MQYLTLICCPNNTKCPYQVDYTCFLLNITNKTLVERFTCLVFTIVEDMMPMDVSFPPLFLIQRTLEISTLIDFLNAASHEWHKCCICCIHFKSLTLIVSPGVRVRVTSVLVWCEHIVMPSPNTLQKYFIFAISIQNRILFVTIQISRPKI